MTTAIWWARRDLRLSDNQALSAALAHAESVIPAFVLDPPLLEAHRAAEKRVAFLFGGLRALDESLRARGGYLVVRHGNPADELAALVAESGAEVVFAEADLTPYAQQRDDRVAARVPLRLVGAPVVHPPGSVLKADGIPYTIFTPFSRKWRALAPPTLRDILPAPTHIATPAEITSLPAPAEPVLEPSVPFPPGEAEAQRRLEAFLSSSDPPVYRYAETRDRPDLDDTSRLSPYLRFGMLSARQALVTALIAADTAPDDQGRAGAEAWLNELVWREFYMHILHHFPHVLERSFRLNFQDIPWENDEAAFAAWCAGRTGYPIVDAAMRQLAYTGWMHNRARMIVASFLVKDLLIDWRWGERFFMQHLVDGDSAANNGGWQWAAGTGTDVTPYFRIFNPTTQGKKHDPEGTYVRRWVPELTQVPDRFIHEPWKLEPETRRSVDYPDPIIDHAWARERAPAAYTQAKEELPG
jgi:deoxyribodipyrimidine photo-lyase